LGNIPSLITLNAANNNIKDMKSLVDEEKFKNLKYLDLSTNRINELMAIKAANLLELNLNCNNINKTETFEGHPKIRKLELRAN